SAITQSDGVFLFPYVPPYSDYRVSVQSRSFENRVVEPVTVYATETAVVNVELALAGHHEKVEERSDAEAGTTSPTLGGTIDARVLTSLPLNTRDLLQLLATDAAVIAAPGGTALYVAGSRSTFN